MTGGSSTSSKRYIDSQIQNNPINLIRSGYYNDSTIKERDDHGYYWKAESKTADAAGNIYFSGSVLVFSSSTRIKGRGYSLRCLIR